MARPKGAKNKPGSRKPGPAIGTTGRSATMLEEDRAIIARLHRRGLTQKEIAEALPQQGGSELAPATISRELSAIREAYRVAKIDDQDGFVKQQLDSLDDLKTELWKAWERSKEDIQKWVKKVFGERDCRCQGTDENCARCSGTGVYVPTPEEIFTREGRIPGSEFVAQIRECIKLQGQFRGVIGTSSINIDARQQSVNMGGAFNWKEFLAQVPSGPPMGGTESEIKAILDKPVVVAGETGDLIDQAKGVGRVETETTSTPPTEERK